MHPHGDVTKGDARQIPAPRYHVAVERVLQQRVYLNLRGVKHAYAERPRRRVYREIAAPRLRQKVKALISLCRGQLRDTPAQLKSAKS